MVALLKIFKGLALVNFQKFWLLRALQELKLRLMYCYVHYSPNISVFKLHFSYHVLSNYTRYIFIAIFWHPFAILITTLFDKISPSFSLQIFVCNWTNSWKAWITGWKYKRALLMNSKTFSDGKQRLSSNTVKIWTSWPKLLKHQNKSKYWTFKRRFWTLFWFPFPV